MKEFPQLASELYTQGTPCSESIVKAAYEAGILDQNLDPDLLNRIASSFAGAMGTGECLCGAIAGSQLVLGLTYGRTSIQNDPDKISMLAREFIKRFKDKRKATCCRALSAKVQNDPQAKRANCTEIIRESADIMQSLIKEKSGVSV